MSIQFPVFLGTNGAKLPEKGIYYLVAKDGIYMRQERTFGSALIKVDEIPHLANADTNPTYDLPKIPARIIGQALYFFREVFHEHRTESYLTLLYSKKLGQYKLWCPQQTVTYASVNYDRTDTVPVEDRNYMGNDGPGYQMIGTIHSHCDFSAFHSGTDQADESTFDGIHITLGHVNRNDFSIVASLAFSDNRFPKAIADVCEGLPAVGSEVVEERGLFRGETYRRHELYHNLGLSDEDQAWLDNELETTIRNVWLPKVTKRIYIGGKGGGLFSTEDLSTLGLSVEEAEKMEREEVEFDYEDGIIPDDAVEDHIEDGVYTDDDENPNIREPHRRSRWHENDRWFYGRDGD